MKKKYLFENVNIVNENKIIKGSVLTEENFIVKVSHQSIMDKSANRIDGKGNYLIPGIIDDQVHFREPGFCEKADIASESRAAIAGGITSYMEMPNTSPQTTTQKRLEDKFIRAQESSLANFAFYIGATNDNLDEILKSDPQTVCGVKILEVLKNIGSIFVRSRSVLKDISSVHRFPRISRKS